MKDLKERILEIIKENSATGTFAKGERSLMLTEPMYEHLSSEIESLIKENYYPKEFLEWTIIEMKKGRLWIDMPGYTYMIVDSDLDITLPELYEYWKNLPK